MRTEVVLAAAFGLCLIATGPALADGGGSGNDKSELDNLRQRPSMGQQEPKVRQGGERGAAR